MSKRHIAILGGGASGLCAANWLTARQGWQDEYDVTVYQMGWRLGGKAASGRNAQVHQRSQEHGYHVLLGFYENVFRTMRAAYEELDRPLDQPLSRFVADTGEEEKQHPQRFAMRRHEDLQVAVRFKGETHYIPMDMPDTGVLPGDGEPVDPWSVINLLLSFTWRAATGALWEIPDEPEGTPADAPDESLWGKLYGLFEKSIFDIEETIDKWLSHPEPVEAAQKLWNWLRQRKLFDEAFHGASKVLVKLVQAAVKAYWRRIRDRVEDDWETYRNWIVLDTASAITCGVLTDDVITKGFDHLNDQNYVDWWLRHAVVDEGAQVTIGSTLAYLPFDLVFGYEAGDSTSPAGPGKPMRGQPQMETGAMLKGMFRFALTYKGTPEYMFQAGCGEVLCAPLYELLSARGVKFKFFARVHGLHLDETGKKIERVRVEWQATPKADYQPLEQVMGITCWPEEPFYDQLEEGEELRGRDVQLGSYWTDWQGRMDDLRLGEDFTDVLLSIPCVAMPQMCAELAAADPRWEAMLSHIKTNRPFIMQAWFDRTMAEMGWPHGSLNGDTGSEPFNLPTTMNAILAREGWPEDATPKTLIYYSGIWPDDPDEPAPPDTAYPAKVHGEFRQAAIGFFDTVAGRFQPDVVGPEGFDWTALTAPPELEGEARIDAQFLHVGIDPWERYVLSVAGSGKYRIKPSESGFDNLYLSGDWTDCGLNSGCMEAAFTSGMLASQAISGYPESISGVGDWA